MEVVPCSQNRNGVLAVQMRHERSSRMCVYADQLMAVLPQVMTWNRTKRKGSGLTPTALTDIKCLTNLDINILYQWP